MSKRGKVLKRYKEVTKDFLSIVSDMAKLEPDDVQWVFNKLKKHHIAFESKVYKIQETFEKIHGKEDKQKTEDSK